MTKNTEPVGPSLGDRLWKAFLIFLFVLFFFIVPGIYYTQIRFYQGKSGNIPPSKPVYYEYR